MNLKEDYSFDLSDFFERKLSEFYEISFKNKFLQIIFYCQMLFY